MFQHRYRPQWQRFDRDPHHVAGTTTPTGTPPSAEAALTDLLEALRDERGFALDTIVNHQRTLRPFLAWCVAGNRPWHAVTAADVTTYLASHPHWARVTIAQHVHHLRNFFRHAAVRRWCRPALALQIDAPRLYTYERLPQGPSWTQVQHLLDAHRGDTPRLLRDRAMLLLLAVYGFRSAEVRGLTLDDIDWQQEIIRPPRPKQRKVGHYPLVREVGDAILAYVTRARPRCACRHVFVRLRPPYQPLTGGALAVLVAVAQKRLGQQLPHYGPHSLRHASATYLLAEGFSLKEIGDHLGHSSVQATQIYAKVDLPSLRRVADLDLAALLAHDAQCAARETPFFPIGHVGGLRAVARVSLGGVR
ncbi:MAG TPA: tyrosine-type recombinase/integrase [Vicinamibacterales bacterium]|nr:tyrosine-type recombinase/integrase [Vicinamibacterales bacterium]